ncbi:hypothetical protein KIH77_07730 [Bifidobacterium sp. 82T24]|uniref:hypothetical protein n=1 Tax=Bifidobacterium pluvialisilvae TaxID=2834436 RepID=UPI001C574FE2|nr:hypothetical protein [Bifidobacterium pluvialisilvae]MBW3088616.1 hypothetical protein [Bifidobacterium pluvialisilvae]
MTNPDGQQAPYQSAPAGPMPMPPATASSAYGQMSQNPGPGLPYRDFGPMPSPYAQQGAQMPPYQYGGYVMQPPVPTDPMQQSGYYSSDGRLIIPAAAPIGGARTMNLSPQSGMPSPSANPGAPYGQYPQYPYGQPPRRSKTGVIIGCVVGVVLVLVGIIGLLAIAGSTSSDSGTTTASGQQQPVPSNDPAKMRSDITRITGAQCTWHDDSAGLNASMVGTEGAYTCGRDMALVMFSTSADADTTMQYVSQVLGSGNDLFGLAEDAPQGGERYTVLRGGTWMVIGGDTEMSALHHAWGGSLQQFGSGSSTNSHGSTTT